VRDEVGLEAARVRDELAEAAEQLVVRDGVEGGFEVHDSNIGKPSRVAPGDEWLMQRKPVVSRGPLRRFRRS